MRLRRPLVVVGLLMAMAAGAAAQLRSIKAALEPVVEAAGVHASNTVKGALVVRLPEGFHTQSNKPRDPSLIATVLTLNPPAGVTVEEIVFPPAHDFNQAGQAEPLAVFEREFVIGVQFALGAIPEGSLSVPGQLRYQTCDESVCYAPVRAEVQWTLNVVGASTEGVPQHVATLAAVKWGTGEKPSAAPPASAAPAPAPQVASGGPLDLSVLERFEIQGTTGGYLGTEDFLAFLSAAEQGLKQEGLFEGQGPLAILLLVLLGGLALNLTPCVLPMIPINLAIIGAGAQAGSRGKGFLLGGVYGAAMALVYGVLGVIVILTAGTFGTINASPWFNVGIMVIFVMLALAMFDVITIDFTKYSSSMTMGGAARGSYLLAFGMGTVAALLAGACVAPVVIQVVLFSSDLYAKGTTAALALPFLLGIGMAIPWPLAGAGIAAMPKPGAWMVRVKQGFGVAILAMAVYYGYTAYALFADRFVDASEVSASVQEKLKEGWNPSLADGLAQAEREGKPVFIDMWATWCKNCLTMDKTTFQNVDVKQRLAGYVKVKFQAEQPDEEPAKSVMQRFNAVGLPTYVVLKLK
ncbi:MAG: cytochrome c biogenesis protein CcdA [Vicinamibacterales bacterium]